MVIEDAVAELIEYNPENELRIITRSSLNEIRAHGEEERMSEVSMSVDSVIDDDDGTTYLVIK